MTFAPSDDAYAYAGSHDGRFWYSETGGRTWTELTRRPAMIQSIAVDWTQPRRVYVALAGRGSRHVYRGEFDAGGTFHWFDVSGLDSQRSLPDLPLTGLALHPTLEGAIYVSTPGGVLRTMDGGDSWSSFDVGPLGKLPNVFISDLDIRRWDRSLFVSTLGRGMFRREL